MLVVACALCLLELCQLHRMQYVISKSNLIAFGKYLPVVMPAVVQFSFSIDLFAYCCHFVPKQHSIFKNKKA